MRTAAAFLTAVLLSGCAGELPEPTERWVVEDLGTQAEFRDVFFLDARNGWIVGGGHNIEGGIIGRTTDGGRTWTYRSGIAKPLRQPGGLHLNAVWFHDLTTGFIVGDRHHLLRTIDGGEHWHKVSRNTGIWAHMRDLQFVDKEYGWAIGNGGLARTTDGGANWGPPLPLDPEETEYKPMRGQAIHFVDRERGWLVGKFGLISSTTDGGISWTSYDDPELLGKLGLWGMDFADELNGWAAGDGGAIVHTADGGVTWKRQTSGVPHILMDVDFVDNLQGWVVGFDRSTGSSVVLSTLDGGATWNEQARIPSEGIRALFVLDAEHAWAVGEQQRRSDEDGSQKLLRYEVDPVEP